jgi:hypothetical protein
MRRAGVFMPVLRRNVGLVFAALVALWPGGASAASWYEMHHYLTGPRYDGHLPPCDIPAVLSKISARFAEKEGRYWQSGLSIVGYEQIRETAYRPWVAHAIPRRFCSGIAVISDGRRQRIHYSIGENTGMIGMTWGVEWCVVGLDRNLAYNPACKMARP